MLFILVDVLERILSWLKSFTPNAAVSNTRNNRFILQLGGHSSQEVRSYFALLCAGPDNKPPLVRGYIAESITGDLIIGTVEKPASASQKVWEEMTLYCGSQYQVRNVSPEVG